MEDQYNLIYNGKMLHWMDGYTSDTTTFIDTTDKPNGCAGSFVSNYESGNMPSFFPLIPIINTDTYNLSYQIKNNGTSDRTTWLALTPYDNKGKFINCEETNGVAGTKTYLTEPLENGDTIVHVNSVANWAASTNYVFGIIESAAYGDNRAIAYTYINSIDTTNNTITLRSAWTGGRYESNSLVKEFLYISAVIYPRLWTSGTIPNSWTNYTETIKQNASGNYGEGRFAFTYFVSPGFKWGKVKTADWRLENTSRTQARIPNMPTVTNVLDYSESTSSVNQYGQLNTGLLSEGFIPARYIRDSINGSSVNTSNHWVEIQAFDRWERNVAYAADGSWTGLYGYYVQNSSRYGLNKDNITTYKPLHIITNEDIDYKKHIDGRDSIKSVTIDMGIIHYIDKIKIWHYYDGGRTYHNTKTEVSADGVNWITVFDSAIEGEYAETADGHTITFDKLGTLYHASMRKGGEMLMQDIIED